MKKLLRFEQYSGKDAITEKADTDLELKSVAKKVFALLKSKGLKPQYQADNVKLDKAFDCFIEVKDGFIYLSIWGFALKKNNLEPEGLLGEIKKQLGNGFDYRAKKDFLNNEVIYRMQIKMATAKK